MTDPRAAPERPLPTPSAVLRTTALVCAHPGAPALHFADVLLPEGGLLLLRGPSGAGKSTWLALVAGLRQPTAGQIEVVGQPLAALRGSAMDVWRARHIGLVPQTLHLSAALSVADNLALAYFAAGERRDDAAIARVLEQLGLAPWAHRLPHQLSGGQAQRVAVARAVLRAPRLLLADEPTASLDDGAAAATLALLQSCAADCGAALVVATHDARAVQALAGAQVLHLAAQSGVAQ